jgi:hypothetical protein
MIIRRHSPKRVSSMGSLPNCGLNLYVYISVRHRALFPVFLILTALSNSDLWFKILLFVDLISLQSVKTASRYFAEIAVLAYQSRSYAILAPYVSEPVQFANFLDWGDSVISGSTALHFCLNDDHWSPADLDIYTTNSGFNLCVQYLLADNYVITTKYSSYPGSPGRSMVFQLSRGLRKIDVIQSSDGLAITPIAAFWSTAVMNGITRRGYFMAYPKLTMRRIGLINHTALLSHNVPDHQTLQCIFKYSGRGFQFHLKDPDQKMCTHSIRWFGDRETAIGLFPTQMLISDECLVETVQWVLGGETCYGVDCVHDTPLSVASIRRVIEADRLNPNPICCEAFFSTVFIDTVSSFNCLFS